MKTKVLSLVAIAGITAMTSCKKDEPASNELGSATINGSIWADLDLTNETPEGIEGMQVSAIVDTKNWDQDPDNNYNYEERVYSANVAADGSYALTIPATETGYNVTLMFGDVLTTRTLANGQTENVRVTNGNRSVFIFSGAVVAVDNEASINVLNSSNSSTYGSAMIKGQVRAELDRANWDAASPGVQPLTGATLNVVWRYDDAPYSSSNSVVTEVPIDANGNFTLVVPTEMLGDNSCSVDFGILDFEGNQIQNNNANTADSTVAGVWSANGGIEYEDDFELEDGDIEVGQDITLTFNPF